MKTYKLHLIRHGECLGNQKGQYIGVTDSPLTTNGIKELQCLAQKGIYPKVPLVFTSPLSRAVETAKIIYPGIDPVIIPNFAEMDFGKFEQKTIDDLAGDEEYINWALGRLPAPPFGEKTKDFIQRTALALREAVQYMMDCEIFEAAAVIHGGSIMLLLQSCALPRKEKMTEWSAANGKGFTVKITPSLYASSGVIEVVGEIPPEGARGVMPIEKTIKECKNGPKEN